MRLELAGNLWASLKTLTNTFDGDVFDGFPIIQKSCIVFMVVQGVNTPPNIVNLFLDVIDVGRRLQLHELQVENKTLAAEGFPFMIAGVPVKNKEDVGAMVRKLNIEVRVWRRKL